VDGDKGKHCQSKPKDMLGISLTVLAIGIVLFLLLFDVACHVTRNKGVINKIVRHRNRRRTYSKLRLKDDEKSTETHDFTKEP